MPTRRPVLILAALCVALAALLPAAAPAQAQTTDALLESLRTDIDAWPGWETPDRGKAQALRVVRSEGLAPLTRALRDGTDAATRRAAARALGLVGDQPDVDTGRALRPLVNVVQDASEEAPVRAAAAFALGFIGDERAIRPLAAVLHSGGPPRVRAAAAKGLGLIGGEAARTPLVEAQQNDASADVRRAAAEALEIV